MTKGPIFIGGCGSSGTTLLRKILNAHSNIAIGPEMSIFDRSAIYEKPFSFLQTAVLTDSFELFENGRMFYPVINGDGSTYFGLAENNHGPKYYHDPVKVKSNIGDFRTTKGFLDWYFGGFAENEYAQRWGEKSPNNVFFINEILNMFPDAVFLAMVRDPRDVVASMLTRRSEKTGPYIQEAATVYRWTMAAQATIKGEYDFPRRCYCIDYESVCSKPEASIPPIFTIIGEDYEPTVMDFWKTEQGDGEFDENGVNYAVSPITDRNAGRWKEYPDKQAMERVGLATRELRRKFGYE